MIYPTDREYLQEVMKFAHSVNKAENLLNCIFRVGHCYHNNGKEYICFLGKDFAPMSFYFSVYQMDQCEIVNGELMRKRGTGDPWMCGGIIFHGNHDNGGDGSDPTFSVCLEPTDGWSIHT